MISPDMHQALIGNIADGVSLVAAINYAQITTLKEEFDPPPKQKRRRSL